MANKRFNEQMRAYGQWKSDLIKGITHFQKWLDINEMGSTEDDLRIYEVLSALQGDRLSIAFVAEFARGKTELINAIFFSEYDRRLLPSEAGRTTMCPTELLYDTEHQAAYIRLLPIETRLEDQSIAQLKEEPMRWTTIELDLDNPENMADAFKESVKTKMAPLEEARKLGLYSDSDTHLHINGKVPTEIEIPVWRHALISFPHPLLKQGLVILDTPGLNAIGSEPELTINMLPNAQAVMFILAADTGVTKSDLDMWKHNVRPMREGNEKGLIVVLNKIDTLWDDLKTVEQVNAVIAEQRKKAAINLGIAPEQIIPASAQKALLAKIRHDEELLKRTNILRLENILANEILPHKQRLVREHVVGTIGAMVKQSYDLLEGRVNAISKQLNELKGLGGKNDEVIQHLMKKTREEQVAYYKNVESFQANKKLLGEQAKKLQAMLALSEIDALLAETRTVMSDSWTTHGLKDGMKLFFDRITEKFTEVNNYANQLNRLVITIYKKFHEDHGMTELKPVLFSTQGYMRDMKRLYHDAEAFRNSPVTTMTEQSFVIKKFFISLASHARNIFFKGHNDAEHWGKAVLLPLVKQIKEHKEQMEKRLENLRKINESRDTLQSRIDELEKALAVVDRQFKEIKTIMMVINRPLGNQQDPAE